MKLIIKIFQSVQLKKTEGRPGLDRTHSVPLQKLIPLPGGKYQTHSVPLQKLIPLPGGKN